MAKMNSIQGSAACLVLKVFSACMQAVPADFALIVGKILGEIAYWGNVKNRRKVYNNLRIALGDRKSYEEIRKIMRRFYHAYGQNVVELARLPLLAKEGYEKYVDVEGREHVEAAMKQGRGLLFLSMHSGNWELSNLVGSMSGYPYSVVANYLRHINKVADYLDSLRMTAGCRIINPGLGGREIIKRLKNNEIVTLVADQGGKEGALISFFGQDASMSTGAVRIALKYDVPICLVDIHRVKGGRHRLVVRPFPIQLTGNFDKDVFTNLERIIAVFQRCIEDHPAEYVWVYSTWKYSSYRRLVILNDGRTGHLRQSEAVARLLKKEHEDQGRQVVIETVAIEFKSGLHAGLLSLIAGGRVLFGLCGVNILRFFLQDHCFRKIFSLHPDAVISCGSVNAPVNYWMAKDSRARSVTILRPGMVPYRNFNLVILPEHDRKSLFLPKNVVLTQAAPNLVDPQYLAGCREELLRRFTHLQTNFRQKFGILIGGDTKGVVMTERQIRIIIHQLKEEAAKYNADFLVTTSRRTSQDIERLVVKEFKDYKRTALLVLASRDNMPEVVGGILALSDLLIVSGESISMVSEASSSGKKTIVFPVSGQDLKPLDNKYTRFVEMLSRKGHVVFTQTTAMAQTVDAVLRGKIVTTPIRDREKLSQALRRVAA